MRLAKKLSTFEDDNILHLIDKACLTRLFKSASRTTIAFAFGDLVNLITFVMLLLLRTGECNLSVNLILFFLHVLASSKIPESPCIIKTHPQFRVFVLANRPGFPFLGNDFFGHWVNNNNNTCIPFVLFLLFPLIYQVMHLEHMLLIILILLLNFPCSENTDHQLMRASWQRLSQFSESFEKWPTRVMFRTHFQREKLSQL